MNIRYIKGFIISFLLGRSYPGYGLFFDDNHFNSLISLDSLFNIPDNPGTLSISTFNIQLLGHFKKKDNEALADLLKDIDIVEIWELVEPLYDSINPDGKKYISDDD